MQTLQFISKKRFFGLFVTQFLGAFNDNLFKNSVVLMIALKIADQEEAGVLINMAAGLFILPFALLSPLAGQISDKFDKADVLRWVKFCEIPIMLLAATGITTSNQFLLLLTIFLMGSQSAFFGPAKYSILPQHLSEDELTTGNGLISMSTFVAIILGLIAANFAVKPAYESYVSWIIVAIAICGYLSSRLIPQAPAGSPGLKISLNLIENFRNLWQYSRRVHSVHLSILAISWFWFVGSVLLPQMPALAKFVLGGTEDLATALTSAFVVGIAIGSYICVKLSRGEIEIGLVPLGAFGMTVCGMNLLWIDYSHATIQTHSLLEYFFSATNWPRWNLILDLAGIGFFGSFYIIPLNALIQIRSEDSLRGQIISANNIINAIFMVAAAGVTMTLYQLGLTTVQILGVIFVANAFIAIYVFSVVPEFFMRFICWILANSIYKITYQNREMIPKSGAAVIVANHVSFIDWFILTAACRRPVRFVMYYKIFNVPIVGWIFQLGKAIPIASAKEDLACKTQAFETIAEELRNGNIVCIFPEGGLTYDGQMTTFRPGVTEILSRDPVPVIPVGLNGLWGSFFSRKGGRAMGTVPNIFRRRHIDVRIGKTLDPNTQVETMQQIVAAMVDLEKNGPEGT